MNPGQIKLKRMITVGIRSLVSSSEFTRWFDSQRAEDGDVIVINNSFIYRKPLIKPTKNPQYLCLKVKGSKPDPATFFVAQPGSFDSDYKLFKAKSPILPELVPLDKALETEITKLGQLVFVLIGKVQDIPAVVRMNHSYVQELKFDPIAKGPTLVEEYSGGGRIFVVTQLAAPESQWNAIKLKLEQQNFDGDLSSLEKAFADAFEKLRDVARLRLLLPSTITMRTNNSFIGRLIESVSDQRKLYEIALQQYANGDGGNGHLREVMRIAYNFADDAIRLLKLLVSVCDLKGVLLWCTIKEHFDLAEAFRNLPWKKSNKKPSLSLYREIISGARNQAFHSLLSFDRTIEADLAGVNVKARRLTLLPPYSRRKSVVPFDFEDREMVEVLSELTRVPETAVPVEFWEKNAEVMRSFELLLQKTEDALWELNKIVQH